MKLQGPLPELALPTRCQALPLFFLTPSGPPMRGIRVTGGAIEGRDLLGQVASLRLWGQGLPPSRVQPHPHYAPIHV